MHNSSFSILITTKNRKDDMVFTLQKIQNLLDRDDVICVVFDDGSTDGTSDFLKKHYPQIILHTNKISKGYLYCRNKMLNEATTDFAISLDDDAHFVTENTLQIIDEHFAENQKTGVLGFRIFWSKESPNNTYTDDEWLRVKSFVGCAHVWRMKAWKEIPNYPEWFVFYGEEDFASYQLFKNKWEVHYLPEVLVNHRVDVLARKNNNDYALRLQRSLRSGWYLYLLFYPASIVPKKLFYSVWMQFKTKVFKGNFKALKAIVFAFFDVLFAFPKIVKNANRLTMQEYKEYQDLENAKIYWKPEDK